MLAGIDSSRIIVGAYTDRQGGICPMLAAHRNGGRTSLASFARAWDRYTGARGRARPATAREITTLRAMLEASITFEETPALPPRPARPRPGDPNRARQLRHQPGWAWLRPFRRLDDYERALSDLAVAGPEELELGHEAVGGRTQ
jgi:hypothetical protein